MAWAFPAALASVAVLLVGVAAPSRAVPAANAPLWGSLSPGPYAVGFRTIYAFDRTRTWRVTRGFDKPFAPDSNGRPIRVSVWYPARHVAGMPMLFRDYVTPAGPDAFTDLNDILAAREKAFRDSRVPALRWSALMATAVNAYANAPPASGRFPVVLHATGLNGTSTSNVSVIAEFLASHGYVVATVPILGPTNEDTEQGQTSADRERTVRDMEFAWSMLRTQPNVDASRLGVSGKSIGGIEALVFAMRNANVSAVVGLDATYGFTPYAPLLTGLPDYGARKMRAAFLDVRRAWKDPKVLDLSAEHGFLYSDRSFVTIDRMHHRDFEVDGLIGFEFGLPLAPGEIDDTGWSRETGYRGSQDVCRLMLDFFDDKLKGDRGAAQRLRTDIAHADGAVFTHADASEPPPSAVEFATLIERNGLDAAVAIVNRYRRDLPMDAVVDQTTFNDYSYRLTAAGRYVQAIGIMRLVTYAYPTSANAADTLADAYIAAGRPDRARTTLEQALRLISEDSTLDTEAKQSMTRIEQAKLAQLKS